MYRIRLDPLGDGSEIVNQAIACFQWAFLLFYFFLSVTSAATNIIIYYRIHSLRICLHVFHCTAF